MRPCVALLHSFNRETGETADPEVSLIPRLDAKEVAAVFTAPFRNFLRLEDCGGGDPGDWYQGAWTEWHQSKWRSEWILSRLFFFFRFLFVDLLFLCLPGLLDCLRLSLTLTLTSPVHQFFVPISEKSVVKPRKTREQKRAVEKLEEQEKTGQVQRYRVFGMTARILVDVARVAYNEEPEFEHNSHFGDEEMIEKLRRMGRLKAERKRTDELTRETLEKAAKLA